MIYLMNIEFLNFLIEAGANLVADINELSRKIQYIVDVIHSRFQLINQFFLNLSLIIIVRIPLTSEAVKFLAASSNPKYSP